METIMTELERCKAEYDEADFAERDLLHKRREEEGEYMRVARETIGKELEEKYGKELRELAAKRASTHRAYDAAIVANAIAELPYPVGTKMVGWKKPNIRWQRDAKYAAVAAGVIEVFSRDSETPENIRYGLPDIGDVVVRLLKEDGTPSKQVEKLGHHSSHRWLPEGEKPKGS